MYAGGQSRANGWGGDGGRDAIRRRRGKPGPSSSSTSGAAAAASSSSGRAQEVEEEGGGNKQWWRLKRRGKREAVARAVSDGRPAAAASCWRGVTVVEETPGGRVRNQRRDGAADGSGHRGDNSSDGGSGPDTDTDTGTAPAAAAWCCVCPGGDCSLEPNPSANGKEDPGVRSLLERNDFFSADCNPHAAEGLPSSAGASW